LKKNMRNQIDLVKHRWKFLIISSLVIVPGIIFILLGGLRFGIDFTGGSSWDLYFDPARTPTAVQVEEALEEAETAYLTELRNKQGRTQLENELLARRDLQRFDAIAQPSDNGLIIVRTSLVSDNTSEKQALITGLENKFKTSNGFDQNKLSLNSTGPTVANEVTVRSFLAVLVASLGILLYLAWAFRKVKRSWLYGTCAILSMVQVVLVVLSTFAVLGMFFAVEVDALFITALLTVVGFSVHDSIVVFDRIRENQLRFPGESYGSLVNHSLMQTLARSIVTSLTIMITLAALYLFGGASIRNFVLALLVGIISGTYSSIFTASMLLVVWENGELGRLFGRGKKPSGGTSKPTTATAR
jgi:preprotein translocase subunit SecF